MPTLKYKDPADGLWKEVPQYATQPLYRVYTSYAALAADWTTAPDGAKAYTTDTGKEWVRRAGAWIRPSGVIARVVDYTATESADAGAAPADVLSLAALPVYAGHVYLVNLYSTVISRASTGSHGMSTRILAGATVLNSNDVYIGTAWNIAFNNDFTGPYLPTVDASVVFHVDMAKSWYSAAGPRWVRGATNPFGIEVIDMGVQP